MPVLVVERDFHSVARTKQLDVVLACSVHAMRRAIDAVPKATQNIRSPCIALLERDEHFVVDIGYEPAAAILASKQRRQPRPDFIGASAGVGHPRQLDLHAAVAIWVVYADNNSRHNAIEQPAKPACHAVIALVRLPVTGDGF